ncbi:MAG: MYG1 family protein [Patescibacteria group bacterium]
MKKLVTHNGVFHCDDIFATATLTLFLDKSGESFEVVRTRDADIIATADYAYDVGGVYDAEKNKFDHHQTSGAGFRSAPLVNTNEKFVPIEYASFGLVWKKFGAELAGGEKEASIIDKKLVAPIDAIDNGFALSDLKYDIEPYSIESAFASLRPTWQEDEGGEDEAFFKCLEMAKLFLTREIVYAQGSVLAEDKVLESYRNAQDKRIIILDNHYPCQDTLRAYPEPLFVISQRKADKLWGVRAIQKDKHTFKNRKDFPADWGGLHDEELQNITGVSDAVFCHKSLFLAVTKSKEGALKLAEIALKNIG